MASKYSDDNRQSESEDALFPERLIETETLRPTAEGFTTAVRLPWYRALPLSCVERMDVSVDGRSVPQAEVTLTVGGQRTVHAVGDGDIDGHVLVRARLRTA